MDFTEFFNRAVRGSAAQDAPQWEPYAHQVHLAEHGLPEVLVALTGTGKTEAAVLGHLYRRHAHPDAEVRQATPRWLALALPTRGLVEQTLTRVTGWVQALGLDGLGPDDVHSVMGGEGWEDRRWQKAVQRDAIFIGTVDMLLSRALNRGYVASRWSWPIAFGAFNNGVQWVFDEVQQMELATVTSRQLQAFREQFGTFLPTRSMWMSATLDEDLLLTVDAPKIDADQKVNAEDLGDLGEGYQRRIAAKKTLTELTIPDGASYESKLAETLREHHRKGSLTLMVCNRVARAQAIASELRKIAGDVEVVLLHRRFRPQEREELTERACAAIESNGPGRIVVTTQVLEAGIDIDATTLITELAPWSSVVQRAGRCNRKGEATEAHLIWVDVPDEDAAPYLAEDLAASREWLREHEGEVVTPTLLQREGPEPRRRVLHTLRRRDLLELFDTSPDLSGDPLDVSQFIREGDERDVLVAWRDEPGPDMDPPTPTELCPVPITDVREWLKKADDQKGQQRTMWRIDPLGSKGRWVRSSAGDLRPGQVYVLNSAGGGYHPDVGWEASLKGPVPEARISGDRRPDSDQAVGDDPASQTGQWYLLERHLEDVRDVVEELIGTIAPALPDSVRDACVRAAGLHDIGKAHRVWQKAARNQPAPADPAPEGLVAKTPGKAPLRFEQRYFRHELASLVALCGYAAHLLEAAPEPDVCRYLVGSHHGRVRLSMRSMPGEETDDGRLVVLGVVDGTELPALSTPFGGLPAGTLDLASAAATWTRVALTLRDREDLGPFRLAFLEALVRLADWEASTRIETREDSAR